MAKHGELKRDAPLFCSYAKIRCLRWTAEPLKLGSADKSYLNYVEAGRLVAENGHRRAAETWWKGMQGCAGPVFFKYRLKREQDCGSE